MSYQLEREDRCAPMINGVTLLNELIGRYLNATQLDASHARRQQASWAAARLLGRSTIARS